MEVARFLLRKSVRPILLVVTPVWWHHYVKSVVYNLGLENSVHFCSGGQRGACINFDQPRLHIVLNENIEAVDFKTVPIVDNLWLHGLKRDENYVIDVAKQLFTGVVASSLLNVESQIFDGPFTTVLLIVTIAELLNGDIR